MVVLTLQGLLELFLKGMNDLSFCMVFVGRKGFYYLFFFAQHSLEQNELSQEIADKCQ